MARSLSIFCAIALGAAERWQVGAVFKGHPFGCLFFRAAVLGSAAEVSALAPCVSVNHRGLAVEDRKSCRPPRRCGPGDSKPRHPPRRCGLGIENPVEPHDVVGSGTQNPLVPHAAVGDGRTFDPPARPQRLSGPETPSSPTVTLAFVGDGGVLVLRRAGGALRDPEIPRPPRRRGGWRGFRSWDG